MADKSCPCPSDIRIEPSKKLSSEQVQIALEIYRQKYELFRHFDRLRWQTVGLLSAACSILLSFAQDNNKSPHWWALWIVAGLLFLLSYTLTRFRIGINKNRLIAIKAAEIVGDYTIPGDKSPRGATWWLALFSLLLGLLSFSGGILKLYHL